MSLSVYLRWEGMDKAAQEAAIDGRHYATKSNKEIGWQVGYAGYLHDFNGMTTVAGTLVRDWFREPAREIPFDDVRKLALNLPDALTRLYQDYDYADMEHTDEGRNYRVGMLTGFVVRAIELHAADTPMTIFVW